MSLVIRDVTRDRHDSALIATDVAARGLDVANVSTVVNFNPAKNLDSHVHCIGRAGRLPKEEHREGVAYTLLTQKMQTCANIGKCL
jgi:ATP-dependent RNA helicase DDX42